MPFALGALERQVPDLEPGNLFLQELNKELMKKAFSVPHKTIGKKFNRMSATFPTGIIGISLEADQHLAFCLARKVSKLSFDGDILTSSWHNQSKQFHKQAMKTQHHASVMFYLLFTLCSRAEQYTPSLFSHLSLLAAIIDAKLFSEQ